MALFEGRQHRSDGYRRIARGVTGWFFNAYSSADGAELVFSSDYQENITVEPVPDGVVELNHPVGIERSNAQVQLGYRSIICRGRRV